MFTDENLDGSQVTISVLIEFFTFVNVEFKILNYTLFL